MPVLVTGYPPGCMSTSPVRCRVRLGACLLGLTLAVAAAACTDSGGDDVSTPTTTRPSSADGATTATATTKTDGPGSSTRPGPTPTGPGTATTPDGPGTTAPRARITPAAVQRELRTLMADYRKAIVAAKTSGAFDENYDRIMTRVFTSASARSQTTGLTAFGGVGVLRQPPGTPQVGSAQIRTASSTCIAVTATVRLDPLVTKPLPGKQPASIRLVPAPADSAGSAWRIDYLDYSSTGSFDPGASC